MTVPPESPLGYQHGFQPRRSNGAAVASLVLGVLGFVPILTGLCAVVLGIVGLRKSRDPAAGGKGIASAGLTLGIISLLVWGFVGSVLGYGYLQSKPAGGIAKQFLADISADNVNAAMANSTGLTRAQLQTNAQQIQQFGTLQTVNLTSFKFDAIFGGSKVIHLAGTATYSSGQKICTFDLVKQGATYKVTACWLQ